MPTLKGLIAASVLSGCAPDRSVLVLPALDNVAAIAFLSSDRSNVLVAPYPDVGVIALEIEEERTDGSLFLLGFPCGAERLTPDAEPLRRPTELYSSPSGEGETLAWKKEASVPDWVTARLPWPLQSERPCRSFSRRVVRLEPPTPISDLVPLDASRVLVTSNNGFHVFDGLTPVPLADLSTSTPSRGVLGLDGEVWLFDSSGRLATGHPDRGFELLPPDRWLPIGGRTILLGAISPEELYAVVTRNERGADLASVFWYVEGAWRTLIDGEPQSPDSGVALLALGPGRALLSLSSRPGVTLIEGDRLTFEPLPLSEHPRSFAMHPELGPIAGVRSGGLLARSPSGWLLLRRPLNALLNEAIRDLAPLGSGIAFVDINDTFRQWFAEDDACTQQRLEGREQDVFSKLVPLGHSFVLAPRVETGLVDDSGQLHVLEPVPLPDVCTVDDGGRGEGW